MRFKVKTAFRGEESDEVWTDSGDCGYNYQEGETYLVYADEDEETDRVNTSVCYRNRRLSDAGDDLAYLFFYRNGGDESARLEGFVTSVRILGLGMHLSEVLLCEPISGYYRVLLHCG